VRPDTDVVPRAAIPADVETPDKLLYGLTARQVAVLAVAAAVCYLWWRTVGQLIPPPLALGACTPLAGAAAAIALGRRDGLPLDAWLLAALRQRRSPRRLAPGNDAADSPPAWAPQPEHGQESVAPAVLRLPVSAIDDHGVVDLGAGRTACLVGATTVNIGLCTGDEQAALLAAYARWLNGLSTPTQIVVSARRADLTGQAERIADAASLLPEPALAQAADDYADFLLDLSVHRDPLARAITVVSTATGAGGASEVIRHAEQTVAALSALGAQTRLLDGGEVAAAITAATDPYAPTDASWPRALAHQPVTATEAIR
jgi:PrgI family protein